MALLSLTWRRRPGERALSRDGGAKARTDTFRELTGAAPSAVEEWITAHREAFASARDRVPSR